MRRAYGRVEKHHPGSAKYEPEALSEYDRILIEAGGHGGALVVQGNRLFVGLLKSLIASRTALLLSTASFGAVDSF